MISFIMGSQSTEYLLKCLGDDQDVLVSSFFLSWKSHTDANFAFVAFLWLSHAHRLNWGRGDLHFFRCSGFIVTS